MSPIKWASKREPFVSTNMPCLTALKAGFFSLQNTVSSARELPTFSVGNLRRKVSTASGSVSPFLHL